MENKFKKERDIFEKEEKVREEKDKELIYKLKEDNRILNNQVEKFYYTINSLSSLCICFPDPSTLKRVGERIIVKSEDSFETCIVGDIMKEV